MEQQTPERTAGGRNLKPMYWLAAAAMTIATVLEALDGRRDWMSIVGRGSLVVALVLLATAKPEETRGKKLLVYFLAAVSIGLFIARLATRS